MRSILSALFLIFSDFVALFIALYLAHYIRIALESSILFSGYSGHFERFYLSGLLFAFFAIINFSLGLYTKRNDFWEELRRSYIAAFLLLIVIVMMLFITKSSGSYSRTVYVLMFLNLLWIMPLLKFISKKLLHVSGLWHLNAYIDGNATQKRKLIADLESNWYLGYRVADTLQEAQIVIIATKDMALDYLEDLIQTYKKSIREVMLLPFLHNISFANAEIIDLRIGRMSFINIQNQLFVPKNIWIKKSAEFLLIVLLLPLIVVLILLLALLIKLDSRGSVFFRQKRLGRDGRTFKCYKFRTMYEESAHLLETYLKAHPQEIQNYEKYHKYENDPRITRVGAWLRKFSIDELPQIINILRFEMNLIGPRPYMLNEQQKLGKNLETVLHVRPGLTGLWQISGRNDLDFYERVELDVWYIQNWSLWLDFIIFLKTFIVLATRRGAR